MVQHQKGTAAGILLSVPVGDRTLGTAIAATLHAISSALLNKDERRSPGTIAIQFQQDCRQIQFETQLPDFGYSAVLQVYRQSVDAPLHAVGGEIWRGTLKEADIIPIHCTSLTARQVKIYLERLLKKIQEAYGIRKFASKEELHPQCCPLLGCLEKN